MNIFAIGDLHLSTAVDKPMDQFGDVWRNHPEKLLRNWKDCVSENDVVLIPGDISWAMHLADALPDFAFIDALPGRKILLRGNHDYWWTSLSKIRAALPKSITAIQNDAVKLEDKLWIGGTRGWACPSQNASDADDAKIYAREAGRLKLSLDAMDDTCPKLIMLHFPPFSEKNGPSEMTELIEQYRVENVLYAHLHGPAHRFAFEGERNGVTYRLVSGDYLGFMPKHIMEL